ncbi:hypothetical protein [Rhodosalinus halophilus]|uniref:hypothetical protein n=1 Tax=Rhodosalinus halophilus TaxID=2259333 RepID=UPI001314EBC9|nr:hypothetical protein [Rhodosalinus halophilus]
MVGVGIPDDDGDQRFAIRVPRQAAAARFIEQVWTPKQIQALPGHAWITMTMIR